MREHGMLFIDRLARALAAGTKTVTRRPITKINSEPVSFWSSALPGDGIGGFDQLDWDAHQIQAIGEPPQRGATPCSDRCVGRDYCCCLIDGKPEQGGYLHVPGAGGETRQRVFCRVTPGDAIVVRENWRASDGSIFFRADATPLEVKSKKWRPSIHMPRALARTVRPVVSVQPEKLGELSVDEARAEGFESPADFAACWDVVYSARGQGTSARPWVWTIRLA